MGRRREPLLERLERYSDIVPGPLPEPCRVWTGYCDEHGYGRISLWIDGRVRTRKVHQVAYELFKGPIPEGLEPDHLCRVRACWWPSHLEAVTHLVNVQRGTAGGRRRTSQECQRAHALTEGNIYRRPDGRIDCLECKREANREYARRRRASL